MSKQNQRFIFILCFVFASVVSFSTSSTSIAKTKEKPRELKFLQLKAETKSDRNQIANLGFSIESVKTGSVWGFADPDTLRNIKEAKLEILGSFDPSVAKGGHGSGFSDFPSEDSNFHNYSELIKALRKLNTDHPEITRLTSIGKSMEDRDIWAFNINTSKEDLEKGTSNRPGVIYMGTHHAREHLSTELPLMYIAHLLENKNNPTVKSLLENRDIWVIPMVNPDGVEWDIIGDRYKMWRKNRRDNRDGNYGVDLNRNYSYGWGRGGSSGSTGSDIYRGEAPFSEPETQTIKSFVESHLNSKILVSVHTFSELILYPWGHTDSPISNEKDRQAFQNMAETMARWNKYTPQQSSDLYIASGDTTDWAYGEHGIFAFTFELSPRSMWEGGFYPGQRYIDKVFQDNLRPLLYLLEIADDPYQVVNNQPTGFLSNYIEPKLPLISQSDSLLK